MVIKIIKFVGSVFKIFFSGKLQDKKWAMKNLIESIINSRRVKNTFKPISNQLTKNQDDYRLIVYKNFNYEKSLFRETFKKNGSNKGGEWKYANKKIRHFYADFYEETLKDKKINNLLEIGIGLGIAQSHAGPLASDQPGASFKSWKEIFPTANIFGADINKDVLFHEERIKTYYTDQLDKNELGNLKDQLKNIKFDVIIDDGFHAFESNINTFEILFSCLANDGLYFIEDIIFKDLKKYYKYFDGKYNYKIAECLNTNEAFANGMVIIKK